MLDIRTNAIRRNTAKQPKNCFVWEISVLRLSNACNLSEIPTSPPKFDNFCQDGFRQITLHLLLDDRNQPIDNAQSVAVLLDELVGLGIFLAAQGFYLAVLVGDILAV